MSYSNILIMSTNERLIYMNYKNCNYFKKIKQLFIKKEYMLIFCATMTIEVLSYIY